MLDSEKARPPLDGLRATAFAYTGHEMVVQTIFMAILNQPGCACTGSCEGNYHRNIRSGVSWPTALRHPSLSSFEVTDVRIL